MENINASKGVSKIDLINLKSGSVSMKDYIGCEPFEVKAAVQLDDTDHETGEVKTYNYLIATDGTVYGGNSYVVGKIMSDLIDLIDDDEKIHCRFDKITTKAGREAVKLVLS